jgi:hypothetical protein
MRLPILTKAGARLAFRLGRRKATSTWCSDSHEWLSGLPRNATLEDAWDACTHGTWLAFWVVVVLRRNTGAIRREFKRSPWYRRSGGGIIVGWVENQAGSEREYADWIRARFTPYGNRKRVRR